MLLEMVCTLSVFDVGTSPRPLPCHLLGKPDWAQLRGSQGLQHWGYCCSRLGMQGNMHAWEESNAPKISAAVSAPLVRQWLAWQIQFFGYLVLPRHPRCSPLPSSLPSFYQRKPIFSLVASTHHPFGSKVAFTYVFEVLWAGPVWYTCILHIYSILLHSLWVVTSPGVMYPGSINAIKIFMHVVAKRLGVFE